MIGMVRRDFEATRANLILDQVRQWSLPVGSIPGNPPPGNPPATAAPESTSFGEVLRKVIEAAADDFRAIKVPFPSKPFGPWETHLLLPGSQRCEINFLGYHCSFAPSAVLDASGKKDRLRNLVRDALPPVWRLVRSATRDLVEGPHSINVAIHNFNRPSIDMYVTSSRSQSL